MRTYLTLPALILAFGCLAESTAHAQAPRSAFEPFANPPPFGKLPRGPGKLKAKTDPTFNPPVVTVVKNDFAKAKGWRITWKGGSYNSLTADKVQSIFSTVTGAVNSVDFLNKTSWGNTNNADMMLYFGDIQSTKSVSQLTNSSGTKHTSFKLTGMKVADLENYAKNDPAKFGIVYSLAFDKAAEVKNDYKSGQIYAFKTDRTPARYGAVRIVAMNPRIIEVVVQK